MVPSGPKPQDIRSGTQHYDSSSKMPVGGKSTKSRPKFSFVNLDFEAGGVSWLKKHSGPTRSHAAYWGGPVRGQRHQSHGDKSAPDVDRSHGPAQEPEPVYGCFDSRSPRRRQFRDTKSIGFPLAMKLTPAPRHLEADHLRYLPLLPFEIGTTESSAAVCSCLFEFFGENFVKRFITSSHEDSSIIFTGCLLLSYAHRMALSGQGKKTILLHLKGHVIRHIHTKIESADGVLSPRSLTAILALGAPIVCLVSQDLPKPLNIRDYVDASRNGDYLCCRECSDTAQRARDERIVHSKAMERILLANKVANQDADSLALLQYVANHMKVLSALDPAHPNTSLSDDEELGPETSSTESPVPTLWTSPLACHWLAQTPTTDVEAKMLSLAELVHRWMSTFFFEGPEHTFVAPEEMMWQRETLREELEGVVADTKAPETEAEAMYECCRWASLMLLAVENKRVPIHVATQYVQIRPRLVKCLRMTDLLNLWGPHKGLLFWVAAICHSSTAGQCFPLLCTTLLARFAQAVAVSGYCSKMAIKQLRRLREFEGLCCRPRLGELSLGGSTGSHRG